MRCTVNKFHMSNIGTDKKYVLQGQCHGIFHRGIFFMDLLPLCLCLLNYHQFEKPLKYFRILAKTFGFSNMQQTKVACNYITNPRQITESDFFIYPLSQNSFCSYKNILPSCSSENPLILIFASMVMQFFQFFLIIIKSRGTGKLWGFCFTIYFISWLQHIHIVYCARKIEISMTLLYIHRYMCVLVLIYFCPCAL